MDDGEADLAGGEGAGDTPEDGWRSIGVLVAVGVALVVGLLVGTLVAGDDEGADDTGSGADGDAELEWLFSMEAAGATVDGDDLVLDGVAEQVVAFSDRPNRASRHVDTAQLVERWPTEFAGDPPNAVVAWTGDDGPASAVVELETPRWEGEQLVVGWRAVGEGAGLPAVGSDGSAEDVRLFVDSFELDLCDMVVDPADEDVNVSFLSVDPSATIDLDWGDGASETLGPGDRDTYHVYDRNGTYTISASGGGCDDSSTVDITNMSP